MRTKLLALGVLVPAILQSGQAASVILAQSNFDFGVNGWAATGSTNQFFYQLDHHESGGKPGGMVSRTDPNEQATTWYYRAPSTFNAPLSGAYGGTLSFSLSHSFPLFPSTLDTAAELIILSGDDPNDPNDRVQRTLTLNVGAFPAIYPFFADYSVTLDETTPWAFRDEGCCLGGSDDINHYPATSSDIRSVLGNHLQLFIKGQFFDDANKGFLDSVVLRDNTVLPRLPEDMPGLTHLNPVMPLSNRLFPDDPPLTLHFKFSTLPGLQTFIDPEIAIGYDYIVNEGPNFASVLLPSIAGDNGLYEIYLWDGDGFDIFLAGVNADITYFFGGDGVDRFRVLGIDPTALLDPANPVAFVTGLTFVSEGEVDMTMTPVTDAVPEPATLLLLGAGLVGIPLTRSRRRRHTMSGR